MFKISYGELRGNDFLSAMTKLVNSPNYANVKVAYNIMRMGKTLEAKLKESQKEWVALVTPLVEINGDGSFKLNDKTFAWKEGVNPAEAQKKIEDFLAKEIIVDRFKLSLDDIDPAKLSPNELGAIEPLLNEAPAATH